MAQTNLMRADEIAAGFNGVTERQYWKAAVAGTRVNPEVHFNSRSNMVRVSYRIATGDFTVKFAKASAAFGDFMASTYKAMGQVLASLKAAGLPFAAVVDEATAVLRIEYDPRSKGVTVHVARAGDDWLDVEPMHFKVPERKSADDSTFSVDPLQISL